MVTTLVLIGIMTALPVVGIGMGLYFWAKLKRFLQTVPVIQTAEDLERFKQIAAGQMYGALVQLVILIGPWIVFGYGLITDNLEYWASLCPLVPYIGVGAMGFLMKPTERRVQATPAATEQLEAQRDHVVDVWMQKPFPNW